MEPDSAFLGSTEVESKRIPDRSESKEVLLYW